MTKYKYLLFNLQAQSMFKRSAHIRYSYKFASGIQQ